MDFSQLPKMSNTPKPPAPREDDSSPDSPSTASTPTAQPVRHPDYYDMEGSAFGFASVWISLFLGLILMMLGANFGRWMTAKLAGKELQTGWTQPDGVTPVRYFELQGGTAWGEAGLFVMGVALLIDALLMFLYYRRHQPSPALLLFAICFTSCAMLLNLGVAIHLFSLNIRPFLTMGALLVGGMMLFDHVPMLKSRNARHP